MEEQNLIGKLLIMKTMNIKPNFSSLQREYGLDRHTIKKYWDAGGKTRKKRCKQESKYDPFIDEIKAIISKPGVNITSCYEYLKENVEGFSGTYNGFKDFLRTRQISKEKNNIAHPRFETKPGHQLQVDWKESLKLHTKNGDEINFNVFSATLGYSRLHLFEYSETRTTEDFLRCMISVLKRMGGLPHHSLTDNMAAIVSVTNGKKNKHQIIKYFEKDLNMRIVLCKVRTPETKGKVESSNRFVNWLYAYDYEFDNKDELIQIIKKIEKRCNSKVNETTHVPPIVLFEKEKEYLLPIPNKMLLESYLETCVVRVVPSTMLVNYDGKGYSVNKEYINKKVKIYPVDNKLYIYYNDDLIATHDISSSFINYRKEDYLGALADRNFFADDMSIEQRAKENLSLLSSIK